MTNAVENTTQCCVGVGVVDHCTVQTTTFEQEFKQMLNIGGLNN